MRGITAKAGLWVLPVIAVLLLAACADTTATPVPPALPQSTATALASPTVAPTTTIAPTNPATTAAAPTATAVPAQPSEVVNPAVTQIIEQKGTAVISTDTVVPPTAITTRSSIPSATPVPPKATVAPATGPTTQPAAGLGIIKGRVTAGPTCPVERAENPCPPAPIANRAVQIRDQSGNSVILTLTTDSQGYFQGQLAAGTYLLTIMSSGALPRDPNGPHRVTVNAGQTANVDIRLDTGIR